MDLMKAAHHGALHGVTMKWIQATQPKVVVISVARRNNYGHPSAEVVQAWRSAGARVYRTDVEGGIHVAIQADGTYGVTTSRNTLSIPIRK